MGSAVSALRREMRDRDDEDYRNFAQV